jgi:outer membrane receptor protein involved in Fe transport
MFNVTFLHTPPAKVLAGHDLLVAGNIIGADQVSIAALLFRAPGESQFQVRELSLVSGDRYAGTIPGKFVKIPAIEYYCYAVDFEGNRHIIFASEQGPQKVTVVTRETAKDKKPKDKKITKKVKPKDKDKKSKTLKSERPEYPPQKINLAIGVEQPVMRVAAMTSVVTRAQIEAMGAQNVADILDQVPGFHIARAVSGEYRLAVRGLQSDSGVLVLLDGHRLNDIYNGQAFLEFPAGAVERIEIVRGPGSALYGSGAFVSVLNIITRQAADVHGSVSYGLYNAIRASTGGGYDSKSFNIGGQVHFLYSQGHDRVVHTDVLTGVQPVDSGGDLSNTPGSVDDGRLQLHGQLHARLKDLGGGELMLLAHYFFQSRGAFVGKFDSLDRGSSLNTHLINTDLTYRIPILKNLKLDARAYFDTHMLDRTFQVIPASSSNAYETGDGQFLNEGLKESQAYTTITVGTQISTTYQPIETNFLTGGIQFEYLSLSSFSLSRDPGEGVTCQNNVLQIQGFSLQCGEVEGAPAGKNRIVFGAFIQDQWNDVLIEGLDFLAGFRLDYSTDFGLAYNPRVGLAYSPIEGLWLKSMYAMAFRSPTFQELYDDPTFDPLRSSAGNASLEPVTSHTWEFGIEGHIKTRPVDFRLQANIFLSWVSNNIASLDSGEGLPAYANAESFEIMGTEVEGVARFGERSRLFANSTWFRSKVSSAGLAQSSYITDIPQMRFNFGCDLGVLSWLNVHLGVRYGSERRNNVRRQLEMLRSFQIPAYTLVRAGLSTEPILFDHFVIFAHVYNIFDHDMRDPLSRPDRVSGLLPRAPITFMAGLAWRP